jgi:hypothetical protein
MLLQIHTKKRTIFRAPGHSFSEGAGKSKTADMIFVQVKEKIDGTLVTPFAKTRQNGRQQQLGGLTGMFDINTSGLLFQI